MGMSTKNVGLDFAETITDWIWLYYIPILIIVGSIGNCLSIYIPLRSSMSRSSASYYMVALALSDEGFLVYLGIEWLTTRFSESLYLLPRVCLLLVLLPLLCNFLSAWFVVGFTVERFVAVRYPLHRQSICTISRAKIILIGITCIGLMICCPVFWILDEDCTLSIDSGSLRPLFFYRLFNSIITVILPFTLIAVMNVLIIKSLQWHAKIRINLTNSKTNPDYQGEYQENSSVSASHTKTTKMLLIVSSVFLGLNLPFNVAILHAMNQGSSMFTWSRNALRAFSIIRRVCYLLLATSFGINFFLYCACGHEFRQAIFNTMSCCPRSSSLTKLYSYLRRIKIDTSKKSTKSSKVSKCHQSIDNNEQIQNI